MYCHRYLWACAVGKTGQLTEAHMIHMQLRPLCVYQILPVEGAISCFRTNICHSLYLFAYRAP